WKCEPVCVSLLCQLHQRDHAALHLTAIRRPVVLVVDDERIVADTLSAILSNAGFDATPVYNGERALEIALEFPPDAVICDIILDGVNGIEVAKQMLLIRPECKVILMSGADQSSDLLDGAAAAGYHLMVLAKPFQPTALINLIRD
ncbi:MAG: response regulator, partial [Acidobacteriota bacterium]